MDMDEVGLIVPDSARKVVDIVNVEETPRNLELLICNPHMHSAMMKRFIAHFDPQGCICI